MKPHKSRARTMSDPQVLGRSVIRASPKKQLLEAGSHTDTQEGYNPFKHHNSQDDMPLIRKNRSFTDNEAGSQNSTEERVLDLKKIVPQIREFREKKNSSKPSNPMKFPKAQSIPEVNIEVDPGMEAGSQTSEIEISRSPTNKYNNVKLENIQKGKKAKTIPTPTRTTDAYINNYKKEGKRVQKSSIINSFNSSTGLAIEAGSETSPGYHPYKEEQPTTATSRKYLNITTKSNTTNKGGIDFGTNAASGNDSVGFENFELVYEAEIAYFQKNLDLLEREASSSDTDGSKAISEGSSTAEGAASAAEGHHEFYFQ